METNDSLKRKHLTTADKNIIFFDAVCELCDFFIQFVFKKDQKRDFLYSPLQGETAKAILAKKDREELKSIVFFKKGVILKESQAIKTILQKLYPRLSLILLLLPAFLSNALYRQIAKRRYKWFGKKSYQASPQQTPYFLP